MRRRVHSGGSPPRPFEEPDMTEVPARSVTRRAVLAENPHIRFFNNRRGYVRTRVTPDELRADFRVVPLVSQPGAPVQTRASFVVSDRDPTLHPA